MASEHMIDEGVGNVSRHMSNLRSAGRTRVHAVPRVRTVVRAPARPVRAMGPRIGGQPGCDPASRRPPANQDHHTGRADPAEVGRARPHRPARLDRPGTVAAPAGRRHPVLEARPVPGHHRMPHRRRHASAARAAAGRRHVCRAVPPAQTADARDHRPARARDADRPMPDLRAHHHRQRKRHHRHLPHLRTRADGERCTP